MYSSSSDLTTIMIRRMFPSWRKDVDVGGGFGDGDNYDDGIGDLDNNDNDRKQYYDDVGGDGGSGRE